MGVQSAIVIGAGVSGLAAAAELAQQNWQVTVLEAQPPANLPTHELPDRSWQLQQGRWVEDSHFWDQFQALMDRVDLQSPDRSFQDFLDQATGLTPTARAMARSYVEGFNAADASQISLHALARLEQGGDGSSHRTFRITTGYKQLVAWFFAKCQAHDVQFHFESPATLIRWKPDHVQAVLSNQPAVFSADRLIVTVPLGVLQRAGPCSLSFLPALPEKQRALSALRMGHVAKIVLEFRAPFWPLPNFGFLQALEQPISTWWADERGAVLTGWAGGPTAEQLLQHGPESLLASALCSLAAIFRVDQHQLQSLLLASYSHDWSRWPYSFGAYSFVPAGQVTALDEFRRPVANTLFFAGEATAPAGEQGTVDSAIASGWRAARQCLAKS